MLITVVGGIVYNMLFAVDVECRVQTETKSSECDVCVECTYVCDCEQGENMAALATIHATSSCMYLQSCYVVYCPCILFVSCYRKAQKHTTTSTRNVMNTIKPTATRHTTRIHWLIQLAANVFVSPIETLENPLPFSDSRHSGFSLNAFFVRYEIRT